MAPSSEDYAAYSGSVDDFFSSRQPFRAHPSLSPDNAVLITAETATMKNTPDPILPFAALGPEDMGQDFFCQNAKSWHLEAQFRSHPGCAVVENRMLHRAAMSGVEELFAPPGFDHTRTRGLVYYDYRCGVLCGQSGWARLRKVHVEWKLDEMGSGAVY